MYFKKIRIDTAEIKPTKTLEHILYINGNKIGSFLYARLEDVKNALQGCDDDFTKDIPMNTGWYEITVTFKDGEWIYIEISDEVYKANKERIDLSF